MFYAIAPSPWMQLAIWGWELGHLFIFIFRRSSLGCYS